MIWSHIFFFDFIPEMPEKATFGLNNEQPVAADH
jgi:hypothetical protein